MSQRRQGYPDVVMPRPGAVSFLAGQVALVTGGSSGIGRACSFELAAAGAKVVVNYHGSEERAREVCETIERDGGQALAIRADVSKEDEVERMFARTLEHFGTVDILVANAGVQKDAPLLEMSLQDWQKVIDINLTGQFLCAREALREFLRRGVRPERSCAAGKIICMSSVHDVIPWAGHANYAASKGGVMMLMKSLAQEFAPHRVRVNAVAPGAIKTRINRDAWDSEDARKALLELIPYNRIGEVEDVARAVVWLASDYADYVNGTTLYVDGGMTVYPGFADGG